jgi:5-methylcytosine-specific restriction endonuclease McrA
MNEVLLLNADVTPVSWLPLSSISWQNAIRLIWLDLVEVLHTYDDWVVRSPSTTIIVPAVLMLRKQVLGFRRFPVRTDVPSAYLIHLRDGFQCQYCGKIFPRNQLTLDHVQPKRYGGNNSYRNLVCCCSPCNSKRGHDTRIQPMTQPFRPTLDHLIKMMRKFPVTIAHPSWIDYLGWAPELVTVVAPTHP